MTETTVPPTIDLPRLADLGPDLLTVSPWRRAITLARPLVMVGLYTVLALTGWWLPALLVLVAIFPVMVAVIHDLLHQSLGLSPRSNRRWLTLMGLLVLQSGHAMKTTHLAHHRRFPNSDDPEAYVADMPLGRALLEGPIYPYRLWTWTRKHHPEMVRRVSLEALGHALLGSGATALLPISRVPFLYAAAMFVGCSLFPAISVNLLHHIDGDNPLTWTRTVGGTVLPFITVGSGYHLEHHLYPRVPSPNYKHLVRRLRPVLASRGVTGYRLTAHRTPSPTGLIA